MLTALAFNKPTNKLAFSNVRGDIILREGGANDILYGHTELIEDITS